MSSPPAKPDPYQLHRAALQPVLQDAGFELATALVGKEGENALLTFIQQQGLAPMWARALENSPQTAFSRHFLDTLRQSRLLATGEYMLQHHRLKSVRDILDEAAVEHVVYKGAAIRERLYPEPALRPAVDIDVLVSDEHKLSAIKALHRAGYSFHGIAENISHEASMVSGNTSIDLHWDIMRPGRTRRPMTRALIETRQDASNHWRMSDEASLFVMLVHPVFTKYSTAPQATLVRTVDLVQLMGRKALRWEETIELLEMAGLKTAAWITLRWVELLTGSRLPQAVTDRLKPGKLRHMYLNWWLDQNLATRFEERPALVQLGFTLPAHDKPTDALRAIRLKNRADRSAEEELRMMESSLT